MPDRREDRRLDDTQHDHPALRAAATATAAGAGGALAGAAAGTITAGPIGTIIGALAGAIGGGWAGLAAGPGAAVYDATHDHAYRSHYAEHGFADRSYEQLRPAYQVGHLAAGNRDYFGRDFEEIEHELQRGWLEELHATHGDWETVRRFARHAYDRTRGVATPRGVGATFGTIALDQTTPIDGLERPSFSDPIPPGDPDQVAGEGMPIPGREIRD